MSTMPDAPDSLFIQFQAALVGGYSLERELGRGGMGVVYLAREVRLDRPVAIKLLPPGMARDGTLRERFLREARTAAKLSHPHIIPIFTVDEVGDFVFFAMAYVDGETLTERVRRRGPLPPSEAAPVLREVAWALAYAHSQGLVHRDVKADNIMLETATGRALVADFGIAGLVRDAAAVAGGEVIGTPEFMSPEQALGEPVDARSDLYALGVVGYFALSGALPFEGAQATEVLAKQATEPPPPLSSVVPGVPRRLARAVEQCLEKDPADRPRTAEELVGQLALEQRKEIPVVLRAFVKHNSRLDGLGVLFYPFGLLLTSAFIGAAFGATAAFGTLLGGLTVLPLAILMNRARRLLKSGFGHGDIGVAFRAELEQQREERAVEHGHGPSALERILQLGGVVGLGLGTAGWLTIVFTEWPPAGPYWVPALLSVASWVGAGSGLAALIMLQRRRDIDTEAYAKFWTGRIGRWLFGLARTFTSAKALPAPMTHRPTELSLGMAAEQLFATLPKDTRQQLRDLPAVVHRLEEDAQKMRRRLEELQQVLADTGKGEEGRRQGDAAVEARRRRIVADLEVERDLVQQRLNDAVRALETIRLNLLRLHAGSGTVQSLTTDLGLAREVAKQIGFLLEAEREVEEELR